MDPKPKFKLERTVQAAAYFVSLAGGVLGIYKLLKLLYLLDRESYKRWGHAVTYDDYVSMDFGPVLSRTYDLIKGEKREDIWTDHFSRREGNDIRLVKNDPDYGLLSEANKTLSKELYETVKDMDFTDLKNLSHEFGEWNDPRGSSLPIDIEDILDAVIDDSEEIEMIKDEVRYDGYRESLY